MLCDMPCECGIPEQGPLLWRQISQLNQLTAEALRQNVLLTRLGSDSGLSSSKTQEKLGLLKAMVEKGYEAKACSSGTAGAELFCWADIPFSGLLKTKV